MNANQVRKLAGRAPRPGREILVETPGYLSGFVWLSNEAGTLHVRDGGGWRLVDGRACLDAEGIEAWRRWAAW